MAPSAVALSLLVAAFAGCSSSSDTSASPSASGGDAGLATDAVSGPLTIHPLDTAILFPLPTTAAKDALLRAEASGARGVLVPDYAWASLPALGAEKNADLLPRLRLVAANIDPCFPSGVDGKLDEQGASLCRKQVRLIFQPVRDDGSGRLTTDDVTVHTFYEMDAPTFEALARARVTARGTASLGDDAIDVHPLMKTGGDAYAKTVQSTLLAYAGASNFAKVTYLALRGGGIGWQMGGVDFVGTKGTDMIVPETKATREELINNGAAGDFASTVDPPTKFSTGLSVLLDSANARTAGDADVRAAFQLALRIDNPDTDLNPGTVDCASCHLATPTRPWAERNRALRAADFHKSYTNPRWNLENRSQTKDNTQSMRCFGYYGRAVAISQRTINEAAAVADFINAKILGGAR